MLNPPDSPEGLMRTGHFVFRVWRKEDATWSWRLRVEAVDSGAWGVFDSMQDALWFMQEHLAVECDTEIEAVAPRLVPERSVPWWEDLGGAAEPVG
jgi:hypothetical protein